MPNETIAFPGTVLIPGLIRPIVSDTSGVPTIDNSELRKIANDVLNAAKYSLAAVAAQENLEEVSFRPDSLEAVFKEAIISLKPERRNIVFEQATKLVAADAPAREHAFGRFGQFGAQDFINAGGFDRVHETLPKLDINSKLLGVKEPFINVPTNILNYTPNGLLLPNEHLPVGFEEFEEEDWETTQAEFEQAVQTATETAVYRSDRLEEIWGPVYSEDVFEASDFGDFEQQAVTDKLAFYIARVKCVDETNPETALFWNISDEIAIGGVTVDENGDTKQIQETYVGGGFDDGDQKVYSPHWRFTWFNMREEHGLQGTKWPKSYMVSLLLVEKDLGGFEKALRRAWEIVRGQVKQAIETAVTGALSGWLGPAIANAIGKVAAWVVDKLVGWIIGWLKDDLFPVYVARCTVPSYHARWTLNGKWGSTWSGSRYAHFYGHGGHYYVEYYWKLFA